MESGIIMFVHSLLIGLCIYGIMLYLGQPQIIAENRSILISAVLLIYMILFGHGLPRSINKNI